MNEKTRSGRAVDILLILMMVLPLVAAMVLKILNTPASEGVVIEGAMVYYSANPNADLSQVISTDLIITDECHKLGAGETQRAMDMLLTAFPEAKLLGATATPDRMDFVDEISRYFHDRRVFEYTLHDAFQDGLLQKPYYLYCEYGDVSRNEAFVKDSVRQELAMMDNEKDRIQLETSLSQSLIELASLHRMDSVIQDTCDKYAPSTDYMRFIVFFSSFERLHDKMSDVTGWFQKAYPQHHVTEMIVTSETEEYRSNVNGLCEFEETSKRIDLIFSCDMLNMGYHVDGLTGILMYRGTQSGIVYGQQLGRVLSSGSNTPGIVFDIVDNLHQQSNYSVLKQESVFTRRARDRKSFLEARKAKSDEYKRFVSGDTQGLSEAKMMEFSLISPGDEPEWTSYDQAELNGLNRRFSKEITQDEKSDITEKDLIVIGKEATYRELIAKTVAEARSMRCRQAWARWIEQGGKPFDQNGRIRSRSEILRLKPPKDHPLPPYCYLKHVSVDAVLDEMGIPKGA